MAIPENCKDRYIFHFTDVHNLDSIIKNGLLCTNQKNERGIKHKNIANTTIQKRRALMDVPVEPGGKVHDYVPFYFSSINPMLLTLLNEKNVDQNLIIYFCIKIQRLEKEDAVFTDSSANSTVPPRFFKDTSHLADLDWPLIDRRSWKVDPEDKQKKMAEALIYNMVDISEIDAIVVFNEWTKNLVKNVFIENEVSPPSIYYDYNFKRDLYSFYYTKFFIDGHRNESLVTGPITLLNRYRELIEQIKKQRDLNYDSFSYVGVADIIYAIEKDFTVLPELNDIIGLQQNYYPHNDTVDNHTKKVVEAMKQLEYYKRVADEKKNVLVFASYLHDIGKGPKNKWTDGVMNSAYPDHPADAIPMLARILTEEIAKLNEEEIRLICMLVVYHDVVGDCIKKGRDKQQIVDLIESEEDIEMLIAISAADANAIDKTWGLDIQNNKEVFCSEIMNLKRS